MMRNLACLILFVVGCEASDVPLPAIELDVVPTSFEDDPESPGKCGTSDPEAERLLEEIKALRRELEAVPS